MFIEFQKTIIKLLRPTFFSFSPITEDMAEKLILQTPLELFATKSSRVVRIRK